MMYNNINCYYTHSYFYCLPEIIIIMLPCVIIYSNITTRSNHVSRYIAYLHNYISSIIIIICIYVYRHKIKRTHKPSGKRLRVLAVDASFFLAYSWNSLQFDVFGSFITPAFSFILS